MAISKATRNALISAGIGVFLLNVGIDAVRAFRKPPIEETLSSVAREISKQCPKNVDEETVLVGAAAGPGLRLRYDYTLPRRSQRELQAADLDAFARSLKQKQVAALRGIAVMRPLMEAGVVWEFAYASSDGHRIVSVEVTPADYR
jgi:hypothetical protein